MSSKPRSHKKIGPDIRSAQGEDDVIPRNTIDYQSEGLDEKVINEILTRQRIIEGHQLRIGPIRMGADFFEPYEIEEFEKTPLPPVTKR